jgi:hypothetical protein
VSDLALKRIERSTASRKELHELIDAAGPDARILLVVAEKADDGNPDVWVRTSGTRNQLEGAGLFPFGLAAAFK